MCQHPSFDADYRNPSPRAPSKILSDQLPGPTSPVRNHHPPAEVDIHFVTNFCQTRRPRFPFQRPWYPLAETTIPLHLKPTYRPTWRGSDNAELTCDRRESGSVTGWRYPWLENVRIRKYPIHRTRIQTSFPKLISPKNRLSLASASIHPSNIPPSIAVPFVLKIIQSRTTNPLLAIHSFEKHSIPLRYQEISSTLPKVQVSAGMGETYQRVLTCSEARIIGSLVRSGHRFFPAVAAIKRSWSSGISLILEATFMISSFKGSP